MITGVAQCGTCIWDPTTGECLSTCRGCYEKREFCYGKHVMLNCERVEYSRNGINKSALGVVTQSVHVTANDLVRVKFGRVEMWVRAQDLDPSDEHAEQRARWYECERELRATIFRLRIALGEAWPYIHEHCTIQTLRDRVLKELKEKP